MIFTSIAEMIGKTPMLELPVKNSDWKLYLKMEKFNPGQSMKDRMALNIILQAEKDGLLKKGGCIIESSSGNTGIGLSMIAAELGYRFIAVVDYHAAKKKIAIMKAYGAEIVYVQGNYQENQVAVKERETLAKKLSSEIPNSFFCNQADNPANAESYFNTLGKEIIDDTDGQVTTFIGSVGTGGSVCGSAKRLKMFNPSIEVIGVEPMGSIIFGVTCPEIRPDSNKPEIKKNPYHILFEKIYPTIIPNSKIRRRITNIFKPLVSRFLNIETNSDNQDSLYYQSGAGKPINATIGKNVDYSVINLGLKVKDREAFNTCRFLAKNKGILVGGSSGGAIYKGLEYIHQSDKKGVMVALVADGGEKYWDTIFDDEWMRSRNLIDINVENQLHEWIRYDKRDSQDNK